VASSPTAPSSPPSLRALLFDADHTLLDTSKAERCALRAALRARALRCPASTLHAYRAINAEVWALYSRGGIEAGALSGERFRRLLAHLRQDAEGAAALSEAYIGDLSRRGDLLPGCRRVLARLKRRFRLGLVTNGLDRVQRSRLRVARLEPFFDVVVTSQSCGFAKPDPRMLRFALEALGVAASETLYVGDDLATDGAAARAAGVAFLWMDSSGPVLGGPEAEGPRVRALGEVADLLAARAADYNFRVPLERKRWTRLS
jgi:YjjG family noncanonical pyrimidine nucleotidase